MHAMVTQLCGPMLNRRSDFENLVATLLAVAVVLQDTARLYAQLIRRFKPELGVCKKETSYYGLRRAHQFYSIIVSSGRHAFYVVVLK
jgi:hypothetical protein